MLYKEAVSTFLYETLIRLMKIRSLQKFRLVGGTSLALQLGHRESVDIDMFSPEYPIADSVSKELKVFFPKTEIRVSEFQITIYLPINMNEELKIDLMSTEDFIKPPVIKEGIRLAHMEDIASMKLEAITSRKEKKDYWDIAILLQKYSFTRLIDFYKEKYPWNDLREVIEHLGQMEQCDKQPDPKILIEDNWDKAKERIKTQLMLFIKH